MKNDKKNKAVIKELSNKYNLSKEQIEKIIESPFIFIRKKIVAIDFDSAETDEDFNKVALNFNIPSIGKLYANYFNFKRLKDVKKRQRKNSKREEN